MAKSSKAIHKAILVWLLTAMLAAAAASLDYLGKVPVRLPVSLGLIFAFYVVATRSLAGRYKDITTLALATMGGLFGYWFPGVYELTSELVAGWISAEIVSGWVGQKLIMPLAIGLSGTVTAMLLYVGTGSERVLRITILASIAAGAAAYMPYDEQLILTIAAPAWHLAVCAGLCKWSLTIAARFQTNCCAFCGFDLEGLRVVVCPSCKRPVASAGPAYRTAVSDHAHQNRVMREQAQAAKDPAPTKDNPAEEEDSKPVYRISG